jgi:hypothetical protein
MAPARWVLLGGELMKGKGGRGGINERLSRGPVLGLDAEMDEGAGEVVETSESRGERRNDVSRPGEESMILREGLPGEKVTERRLRALLRLECLRRLESCPLRFMLGRENRRECGGTEELLRCAFSGREGRFKECDPRKTDFLSKVRGEVETERLRRRLLISRTEGYSTLRRRESV